MPTAPVVKHAHRSTEREVMESVSIVETPVRQGGVATYRLQYDCDTVTVSFCTEQDTWHSKKEH